MGSGIYTPPLCRDRGLRDTRLLGIGTSVLAE
jgi:hypothetical protein